MTREEAILWMRVLKHSKINWVGEQAEDEDIIARCEEAEQEAFDMAIEALQGDMYCPNCGVRLVPENEYLEPTQTHGRLIDADALKETMKTAVVKHICTNTLYNTIMAVIDGAPTVQADAVSREHHDMEIKELKHQIKDQADMVSVVRCKDCRHRDLFSCPLADNDFQKDEDFCSWGERREK